MRAIILLYLDSIKYFLAWFYSLEYHNFLLFLVVVVWIFLLIDYIRQR